MAKPIETNVTEKKTERVSLFQSMVQNISARTTGIDNEKSHCGLIQTFTLAALRQNSIIIVVVLILFLTEKSVVSSAHRQISKVEDMYWVVVFRGKMERWVLVPVLGTALSLFDTFIDDLGEKSTH